ncbi:MAG: DUF4177 domain-containing protein [Verrucomicrobiota bacterium JB023]|nr:DUF4177 domain-containing protein [Verrucomicrobiota bacterium JB023]
MNPQPSNEPQQYKVFPLATGLFSGTLNPVKLEEALNSHARDGWSFVKSIHETKKVLGIFSREAHFLIFRR